MIKAILIFNNHGKPRLIRFYQYFVSIVANTAETICLPYNLYLISVCDLSCNEQHHIYFRDPDIL